MLSSCVRAFLSAEPVRHVLLLLSFAIVWLDLFWTSAYLRRRRLSSAAVLALSLGVFLGAVSDATVASQSVEAYLARAAWVIFSTGCVAAALYTVLCAQFSLGPSAR